MSVSNTNKIAIGLVALGALGFLVWRQQKKDAQLGVTTTQSAELPPVSGPEDVDKISVTNADKGEVVLEKKDDKWVLTKPLEAPANQANVKSLIDNLKELKAKEVVADNADEATKKGYDLDLAHAVHLVAWKGADKKVDDWFGKSGGRGEMMMVAGKPAIYAASGYSSFMYAREVKGWRDTEIFKFDDANANSLEIVNTHGKLSFTKNNDKWTGTSKDKPLDRFDDAKVGDALRAFKALTADDFGDGKSPSDTGLDKPDGTVTINLKDNAGKYVLHVGKVSTGTSHYAQKEGDPTIYTIASWTSDWALGDESKFQKALDGGAPAGAKDAGAPKKK
jgi:hypothetical protein